MNRLRTTSTRLVATCLTVLLAFPGTAFAKVRIDETDLAPGSNEVGGGTATYGEGSLDMSGVTANNMYTDESLTVNFDGGNDIDKFDVGGDAAVTTNFQGENKVEDIQAHDNASVTVNMNEHNDFEDIEGYDNSSITANVSGEASCEAIKGYDDATVTVTGTTCPKQDVLSVGEGEASERISTERGDLTIKDVTIKMESKDASVSSTSGNASIACSKISGGDDNERTTIYAGGDLFIGGSVIDVKGSVGADGKLTIRRSNVDVKRADDDDSPALVWSNSGIDLIEQKNGRVLMFAVDDQKTWFVDTDDGDDEVHLKSALTPCYEESCSSDDDNDESESVGHIAASRVPNTVDASVTAYALSAVLCTGGALLLTGLEQRRHNLR